MKYKTGEDFRRALDSFLKERHRKTGLPLSRLRKVVAFERFLARLVKESPGMWILKGGLAIEWRIGDRARATKDIDTAMSGSLEEARTHLMRAGALDLGDWFTFEVGKPSPMATGAPQGGLRFPVQCRLGGKLFEQFHLDIGAGDPVPEAPEEVTGPSLLEFAGIAPSRVPCYPLSSQIAEKLHAYTRQYTAGETSRVKDLVDILLIASQFTLNGRALASAIEVTFLTRKTHDLPKSLPKPPGRLAADYGKMVKELDLGWASLDGAWDAAARFLNPVLQGSAVGRWSPGDWMWQGKA